MTTTLDLKHPEKAGTLGAGLLNLDAQVKNRVKQVKQRIPADASHKGHEQVKHKKILHKKSSFLPTLFFFCVWLYLEDIFHVDKPFDKLFFVERVPLKCEICPS